MSEKITLLDGIKWLEKYCKSLIPIILCVILGVVCFDIVNKIANGRNIYTISAEVNVDVEKLPIVKLGGDVDLGTVPHLPISIQHYGID